MRQIKVALRTKGVSRCIVVSDIGKMAGCPAGDYGKHGELMRLEPNGKMWMPGRGVLAGSASHMLQCCNHLHGLHMLSFEELWQVVFVNPLRLLGVDASKVDGGGIPRLRYEPHDGFTLIEQACGQTV
jgi:N-acetylglucosamine-6-phosphate deacetylase